MEGSDWIVLAMVGLFLPLFVIGLLVFSRSGRVFMGGEVQTRPPIPDLSESQRLQEMCRAVAAEISDSDVPPGGGLRFVRRGLPGRVDFIAGRTEIQVDPSGLVRSVVEVLPVGFPVSLFSTPGKDRLRARGSKPEYDRIFKGPAEEHLLLEIGVRYELRISPDDITWRIFALPQNAPSLSYWLGCAFRLIDLLPGIESAARVQVTGVETVLSAAATCQVCGSTLAAGSIVRCALCRTPHHQDCWQYTQKCSTFGCRSQSSIA